MWIRLLLHTGWDQCSMCCWFWCLGIIGMLSTETLQDLSLEHDHDLEPDCKHASRSHGQSRTWTDKYDCITFASVMQQQYIWLNWSTGYMRGTWAIRVRHFKHSSQSIYAIGSSFNPLSRMVLGMAIPTLLKTPPSRQNCNLFKSSQQSHQPQLHFVFSAN